MKGAALAVLVVLAVGCAGSKTARPESTFAVTPKGGVQSKCIAATSQCPR